MQAKLGARRRLNLAGAKTSCGLIQDVAMRWNSSYYMIERVLEQQQPLCATLSELKKGDFMPSDVDFSTMENYVKIMKPLVDITEAIGAEK